MCLSHVDTVQNVDKVCLLNEVEYILEKYTSAYFYAITDGKEKFIFYEYGTLIREQSELCTLFLHGVTQSS